LVGVDRAQGVHSFEMYKEKKKEKKIASTQVWDSGNKKKEPDE